MITIDLSAFTSQISDRALPSVFWNQYGANILKTLQDKYPSLKGFIESIDVDVLITK